MKGNLRNVCAAVSGLILFACGGPSGAETATAELASGVRSIVVFAPGVTPAEQENLVAAKGGVVELVLPGANGLAVTLPSRATQARLSAVPGVRYVEDDVPVRAFGPTPPPQPAQVVQWWANAVNAPNVWSTGNRGELGRVGIVDTGVDLDHPDRPNVVAQTTYVKGTKSANDDNGHGTHVAGIVAAPDNAVGVVGVAPAANVLACKALDRNGSGWISAIVACLDWATQNGANVINMSLGSSSPSQSLKDACDRAYAAGVVLVAAAGNSGDGDPATNNVGYPAGFDSVVAVAATNNANTVASWSSDGSQVELAAPGMSVYSTYKGDGYATLSGTSMASPNVAGVVALVRTANPALTSPCVRNVLGSTAVDLGAAGRDVFYGWGGVDAVTAVAAAPSATCP